MLTLMGIGSAAAIVVQVCQRERRLAVNERCSFPLSSVEISFFGR